MASHSRKQYFVVFAALFILTVLEVAVANPAFGIARGLVASALILLAVVKAACVALYYMHLKSETSVLRRVVVIPLMIPPFYAVVLMLEALVRRGAG